MTKVPMLSCYASPKHEELGHKEANEQLKQINLRSQVKTAVVFQSFTKSVLHICVRHSQLSSVSGSSGAAAKVRDFPTWVC